jgi:hypothetical protein
MWTVTNRLKLFGSPIIHSIIVCLKAAIAKKKKKMKNPNELHPPKKNLSRYSRNLLRTSYKSMLKS